MVFSGKSAVKMLQYINAPIIKSVLKQYNFVKDLSKSTLNFCTFYFRYHNIPL